MTWLALILACAVSSVIWYLGLTWCAPAFLAIAYGVCLAIVQAWRMAGRVTKGPEL